MRRYKAALFSGICFCALLVACNSSTLMDYEDEDISDLEGKANSSSSYENYGYDYSSSSYGYSSGNYSSGSASTVKCIMTAKTLVFTLTYYKQISAGWDGTSKYTDGDPRISFTIYFIKTDGDQTKYETDKMLSEDNIGVWSGAVTIKTTVPAYTNAITVCPKVIDKDVIHDDDKSSGYCYTRDAIGLLDSYETVPQSETHSSDYALKWQWYLE